MRRIFVMMLMMWCVLSLSAAGRYAVFRVSGDVKKKVGTEWVAASPRDGVGLRDQFSMPARARLGIVDRDTRQVYYIDRQGVWSVANIIAEARRSSDNSVSLVNRRIAKSLKGDGVHGTVVGASYRGDGEMSPVDRYVADYIAGLAVDSTACGGSDIKLAVKVDDRDSTSYFVITNTLDSVVYVNVAELSSAGARLCLNIGYTDGQPYLMVGPHETVEADWCRFVAPEPGLCRYAVVGVSQAFDTQAVQRALRYSSQCHGALPPDLRIWSGLAR